MSTLKRLLTILVFVPLLITTTVSYSDTVSARAWTVQNDGQHADLAPVRGFQSPGSVSVPAADDLDPAALQNTDWWATVQEDIRQSEYHITWQEQTWPLSAPDVSAPSTGSGQAPSTGLRAGVYQAPNRAHNLRTYFTPEGLVIIPRVWPEGAEATPWRWGLTLTGYGYAEDVRAVAAAELGAFGNRIEYRRGAFTEWHVNDERGLEQGLTLLAPPARAHGDAFLQIGLALAGDLVADLSDDGQTIEFTTSSGESVLRYANIYAADVTGRQLPVRLELSQSRITHRASRFSPQALSIIVNDTAAVYPITVVSTITGLSSAPSGLSPTPDWTADGDQTEAAFGYSLGTAGDVNGDGFADVIVGAPHYDNGETDEGAAFVYHGASTGLIASPAWTAESNQTDASFGILVGTAGDVNGDGFADVIVGANQYDNGQTDEGAAFVYHGSATGLSPIADWTAESDQAEAHFGSTLGTAGDVNGDGYADVIVGAGGYDNGQTDEGRAFVYHGSTTGLSTTPDWTAEGDQANAIFGSTGTAGDVNGDGYSDVIIGASYYDSGQTNEGKAWVYHGASTGLGASPAWMAESDQADAHFGSSVGTAGDVNGDGYADVIVGAPGYDGGQTNEGRAYVYHGASTGLGASPAWTAESDQDFATLGHSGDSVSTAGDVNGDGYADVIVGAYLYDNGQENEGRAYVYHGSSSGLTTGPANWTAESNQTDTYFGFSVGVAGDVNGDGYADVIVGATGYDSDQVDEGRVFVYHGASTGLSASPAWTAESDQANASFSNKVSTAGDINGDGYADIIIGAYFYDNGQVDEGRVFVYHGSATGLDTVADWTAESDQNNAYFGYSVGTAGDVNGDGYTDIIIGAHFYDNDQTDEGVVFVYHGGSAGLTGGPADWTAEGDQNDAEFGCWVGTAGDVNGDGYADVVIGATRYDNGQTDEGQARIYLGSATGLSTIPEWTAEGEQTGANFGFPVGTAGDVNGDGYADVIIGALHYDNGQTDEGAAFVYYGSSVGLSSSPDWTAEGEQTDAHFASKAGTAGDVNGDGYADVIIGIPLYDNGQTDEGAAFVYYGSPIGLSTYPNWTAEGEQPGAYFGDAVGTAGDVNGDGYADVIVGAHFYDNGQTDEGRAFVYHGSAVGLGTTANWTVESNQENARFGFSAGTAGDVNGDGYADVIVGACDYNGGQTAEGRAYVYYGNGGAGLSLRPRQLRIDGSTPIAPQGVSDSPTTVQLGLTGHMPLGREKVKLQWQVAPLGTPFTATTGVISGSSAAWIDILPGGVIITQNVTGLTPFTPYHWRARLLYYPGNHLGQSAGRWVHIPWNGWTEQDFRTMEEPIAGLVVVNDSPTVLGDPTTLTATVTAGSNVAYAWAFGDGDTGSGAVLTHTYPAIGVYTTVVTAGNSVSVVTATTAVTIIDLPIAGLVATNDSPTVLGDLTTLTATITAGSNVAYAWDFGDGTGAASNYSSGSGLGLTIPDNGCGGGNYLEHTIHVPTWGTVLNVDVAVVDLRHTWDADLDIYLRGPDGTQVELSTGNGGSGDDYYDTIFDDEATIPITDGTPPFTGRFQPEGPLSAFDGKIQQGDWVLRICDSSPTIVGTLNEWSLTIESTTPGPGGVVTHTYQIPGAYTAVVLAGNAVSLVTATTTVMVDEVIAGLSAVNDSPTALGNVTAFAATVTAGSNVAYAWDFGDGTGATSNYSSGSGLGLTIPDNGCGNNNYLEHTIHVPTWGAVLDVDATVVDLRHTWDADLDIYLRGPDGAQVELSTGNGGSGDDYYHTIFDDEASTPVTDGTPPFTGRFQPEGVLFTFDGRNQQGDWTLRICDDGPVVEGVLNEWSLTIESTTPGPGGVVTHTYQATGTYTAMAFASNSVSLVTATTTVTITPCTGLSSVSIGGPTSGYPDTPYVFAAAITPPDATEPITYTWSPEPSSGQETVNATYAWAEIGVKTITVTVENCGGVVTDVHAIEISAPSCPHPLTGVGIIGPNSGYIDTPYSFTAVITPSNATTPITYTWSPGPESGQGMANALYAWGEVGVKTITVTARNCGGTFSDIHTITLGGLSGDDYEPDDTCADANPITTDGVAQSHTFHQYADKDWVYFSASAGATYVLQTANVGPDADTILELHDECEQPPIAQDENPFGTTAQILWTAPADGVYYLKVYNHDPDQYGDDATYDLSIRIQPAGAAAIIVAGHDDGYRLQSNIYYCTDRTYDVFANGGIIEDNIYYLTPDDDNPDRDADSTSANLQYAIETWAAGKVGPGVPLYLYLMDHGGLDTFLINGSVDTFSPADLDGWLTALEGSSGADTINVFIESCRSGSFVVAPQEVAGPGRVVIASTSRDYNAYASAQGAYFSDAFFSAVGESKDLCESFHEGESAVRATGLRQEPWIDDDGDAVPNEVEDCELAQQRGLAAFFGDRPPVIDVITVPLRIEGYVGTIQARVRDDIEVDEVWAVIYPPSFEEPEPGDTLPELDLVSIKLFDFGNGEYSGTYGGFTEIGQYHIVVYAEDDEGDQAAPKGADVRRGWEVYLPVVMKN